MPDAKPLPDLTLGTRFPARLLNVFPAGWKRRHLIRGSGVNPDAEGFSFTDHFRGARRILIAWPADPTEILVAFPAARALVDVLPPGTECVHLCEASCSALVQGLFPNAMLAWNDAELAWHDPALKMLVRDLRAFAPDITIAFTRSHYPTVLQAVLRASGAKARVGWDGAVETPFVNTSLRSDPATPLAARYFQGLDLWRYAGFSPRGQWTHLQPDTGRHAEALREWEAKRAAPESTWLFVQDAANVDALDAELFETLHERIRIREPGRFTLGAVLWNPGLKPVSRQGKWLDAPVFNESDFSALLAALDGSRGVIGYHCFALHFASLVETRCVALLDPSESLYDASVLNPLFEVEWL
jgi:hypothetical protein